MNDYRLWSTLEIKLLSMGIMPKGRSPLACRTFCRRNGVQFPGKRQCDANERLIKDIEEKFSQEKDTTMTKNNTKKTAPAIANGAKTAAKAKDAPDTVKATKQDATKSEERSYSFRTIDVDKILGNGDNVREVNDIEDLVSSIQAHGIINPITVTQDVGMATYYRVIAGFRRLEAAKQLKLKKIPCHVVDKDAEGFDEIPLSENVSRMGMTPYEECLAVKSLANKKKTPGVIAKHFGRTLRWVLVRKKLADAGEKVLKKVKEGVIGLDAAAKIADLPDNIFKRELESCYRTDKYFIDGVLDRYHKDLSRAPFEHEACLQCDKCSACQADLFENEPKAYCLDPNCWARKAKKAAEAKVKKLQEEGRNARLGKFTGKCISYSDEADKYDINSWDTKGQEQAKAAGIQKRVLVDAATGKTLAYYDKRDLPDYHEETEEERKERLKLETMESHKKNAYEKLMRERLQDAIASICVNFQSQADIIVTLLVFVADNNYNFFDDESKKIIGIDGEDEDGHVKYVDEMPDDKTYRDVADAVRFSIGKIVKIISDIKTLQRLYKAIGGNVSRIVVTDEEVEEEIKLQDELKAAENSDKSEDEDNLEDEDVDNE